MKNNKYQIIVTMNSGKRYESNMTSELEREEYQAIIRRQLDNEGWVEVGNNCVKTSMIESFKLKETLG